MLFGAVNIPSMMCKIKGVAKQAPFKKTSFSKYVDFLSGTASVSPNTKTDLAKCQKDKSLNFKDLSFFDVFLF